MFLINKQCYNLERYVSFSVIMIGFPRDRLSLLMPKVTFVLQKHLSSYLSLARNLATPIDYTNVI